MQDGSNLSDHILSDHIQAECARLDADSDFAGVITDIAESCAAISKLVRHGRLAGNMAAEHDTNVQDETQKELDIVSNNLLIEHADKGGHLIAVASEEMADSLIFSQDNTRGKYLLVFDPLDGSLNIGINAPVGTIFSVLRAPEGATGANEDFLQPGSSQLCAGYVLYGISTEMVITFGAGVAIFTLDPDDGIFKMTDSHLTIAEDTSEYAINASNQRFWEAPVQRYISECLAGKDGPRGRDFNMRWVGAMVADVHRVLSRSGVFTYPVDEKIRARGGRLRLMYEANPMAMIVEQAGGLASTGHGRIMEIAPHNLHQRAPVILGSKNEVQRLIDYYSELDSNLDSNLDSGA